MQPIFQSMFNS